MPKVPFTPEGVAEKTAALYALNDNQLLIEAQAVGSDFSTWFRTHFKLTESQEAYLSLTPPSLQQFWGYLFGSAFIGRRPIILASLPDKPRRTKQGNSTSSVSGTYVPERDHGPAQTLFAGEVIVEFTND